MASTPCYYGDAKSTDGDIYIIKWTVSKLLDVKETEIFCPKPTGTLSERQLQLSIEILKKDTINGITSFIIKLKSQTAKILKSVEVQAMCTFIEKQEITIFVKECVILQPDKYEVVGRLKNNGSDLIVADNILLYCWSVHSDPLQLKFKFVFPIKNHCSISAQLNNDLEKLFLEGLYSDIIMKSADGEEFKVYKAVLASRCAVLKANFEHNTIEATTNIVESPFESAVLKQVLLFIYTDRAEVNENTEELLAAAEYYQLSRLKSISEDCLEGKLTVDNAIKTLLLADLHNADKLKQKTLEFIKGDEERRKLIYKTEGWKQLESVLLIKAVTLLNKYNRCRLNMKNFRYFSTAIAFFFK